MTKTAGHAPRKPRVVMAGPMPPAVGGMVTVMLDLAHSTLRDEFEIELFDTTKKTPENRSLLTALTSRFELWRRWWDAIGRPTVIAHIHTCSGLSFFLDVALLALARMRGVPVVLHVHGGRFDAFLDGLDPLRRLVARAAARSAGRVIVLSEAWRQRLESRLPHARLQVVENGVPIPATVQPSTNDAVPLILFLGAVCRAKGVEDLVRAFVRVPEPACLALVGPEGEAGFASAVQALSHEFGLADRVLLPGVAVGAAKAEWLERASVFVLPSHAEGQPVSVLEAMAAALPVVATRVGSIPGVIDSGRTGLLIDAGDVGALAAALTRLLADPVLRSELGRNARAECIGRFSINRTARALRGLYGELSGSHPMGAIS